MPYTIPECEGHGDRHDRQVERKGALGVAQMRVLSLLPPCKTANPQGVMEGPPPKRLCLASRERGAHKALTVNLGCNR